MTSAMKPSSAPRHGLLKNARAFLVSLDGAFNGFDLTAQPLEPIEQLHLFVGDVVHYLV